MAQKQRQLSLFHYYSTSETDSENLGLDKGKILYVRELP